MPIQLDDPVPLATVVLRGLYFVIREARTTTLERRRTQPIVIAHEENGPSFGSGVWSAELCLTSDGASAAFNLRFGIELRGIRFAYMLDPADHPRGNPEAVLAAGSRLPRLKGKFLQVRISSAQLWEVAATRQDGKLYESRAYWCRYRNALGQTWETRNPWSRSDKMTIRRIRWVGLHERLEARRRARASRAWEMLAREHEREGAASSGKGT